MIEETVRPVEIAGEIGATPEDVIRLLDDIGAKPLEDWRGYPVVAAADAKRLVEKVRAEEMERERRRMALEAASRAYNARARQVYEEALALERARQRQQQAEDMRLLDNHPNSSRNGSRSDRNRERFHLNGI
jgi:hypothetical protein